VPVIEVEQVLYRHPAVRAVAIVGLPDARLGERACAFVVLKEGEKLDFAAMTSWLEKNQLAKQYWPERLKVMDAMPLTPSGKIQKFQLRALAQELFAPPEPAGGTRAAP
jgi:cyclohexanecarboxylate-CoA ligase